MASEESSTTGYVVFREISIEQLQGDVVLAADSRLYVTDGKPVMIGSSDQAIRQVIESQAETAGAEAMEGVYATCPGRSWSPEEYEITSKPVARRKRS